VIVSFVKVGALKTVLRVVKYVIFDVGEIRNKRAALLLGSISLVKIGPGKAIFIAVNVSTGVPPYPRVIRSKTYRGYMKPWVIPNAIYNVIFV
jgi:hypothetical protein